MRFAHNPTNIASDFGSSEEFLGKLDSYTYGHAKVSFMEGIRGAKFSSD